MMTEKEWNEAVKMRENYRRNAPKIIEAAEIVGEVFPNVESIGVLRVRQHARSVSFIIPPENLAVLIENLQELLT